MDDDDEMTTVIETSKKRAVIDSAIIHHIDPTSPRLFRMRSADGYATLFCAESKNPHTHVEDTNKVQ